MSRGLGDVYKRQNETLRATRGIEVLAVSRLRLRRFGRNGRDMPHVGSTAPAKNVDLRKPPTKFGKLPPQLWRVAIVQLFGHIQLGVAASRGVRNDAFEATHPGCAGQNVMKMVGVSAIDHELGRGACCRLVHCRNCVSQ